MKILATADLHGSIEAYEKLAACATRSGIDAVIIAGDLTARSGRSDHDTITSILLSVARPVLFVMGNYDLHELRSQQGLININQRAIELSGFRFTGYQYTNPFIGGPFEKTEDEQDKDLVELKTMVDHETILVTHGPCYGILDRTGSGMHVGSRALGRFVDSAAPRFHIFGHIHESFGVAGRSFNVSYPFAGQL